jgi:hypothetical protein
MLDLVNPAVSGRDPECELDEAGLGTGCTAQHFQPISLGFWEKKGVMVTKHSGKSVKLLSRG